VSKQGTADSAGQSGQGSKQKRIQIATAWIALLTLALGLRIGLALRFPSINHPDEIFQTLEPAHRLAYGYGVSSWEWREGIRSWVFPTFLAGAMRATGWMGGGSAGYLAGIVVVLSLASLSTVWFGFAWARRIRGNEAAAIAAGACALHFALIYFAPKALTEVAATNVLLPGLYLGAFAGQKNELKRLFAAGILCGLAASLRIQLIPPVVFAAAYFCYPNWRRRLPVVAAGLAIPVLAFGLVDKLTWSYPWQSFLLNFQVNVFQGRSQLYGVEPWYWYLPVLFVLLGPTLPFIAQGARRTPFLAAVAAIVVGSHSLLAHKDPRFMIPVVPLVLVLGAIGFVETAASSKPGGTLLGFSKKRVAAGVLFFAVAQAYGVLMFAGWWKTPGTLLAIDRLSREPGLCGVGTYVAEWTAFSGYSHLHQNVPVIAIGNGDDFARQVPTFNVLVAADGAAAMRAGFAKGECWNGICIYRRPGACKAPQAEDTMDGYLQKTGQ
jgi:hypothetical protein